ncbi:E3 ubiquitin-protein ligase TM129-like [Bolinopsis microptera]|uniref:E3 ubiquitin-protein ligase TM129-like n=1 Tax=Bolinopsis microptera TaxID=2820187 RepID=UPI00307AA8DC
MLPQPVGITHHGNMMVSEFALASIVYFLVVLGFVFPPPEFYGIGLTVESMFRSMLGDEAMHFTEYHMRLTSARLLMHCWVIPNYYLCSAIIFEVVELNLTYLLLSSSPLILACIFSFYWYSGGSWKNHPLAKTLAAHASHSRDWVNVSDALATEFRRVDKFVHGRTWGKVVVTDNWIIRCGLYVINVAYQPDVHMSIQSTTEHINPETRLTTQFININVSSVNAASSDFRIRLNSTDYNDLCNKVSGTILNVRNVVFHETLTEKFEEAFKEEVTQNGLFQTDREREECIGCLYALSDVKISKLCDEASVGDCKHCLCRPMWCMRCMAKWFANRQDQNSPDKWLSGKAPCPTCRSKFCLRDVQFIAS